MRIISGTAGGRILKVPKGHGVRPTPDLVRQAIFNSLGSRVTNARVLELFGGTGALGLECLSRGACEAICVEKSARYAAFIRDNARRTGLAEAGFRVRVMDAFEALRQFSSIGTRFDLVMADPPYGAKNLDQRSQSFAQKVLDDANLPGLMLPDSLLVLGHAKRDTLELPVVWRELKTLKHGDSVFRILAAGKVNEPVNSGDD